MKTTAVFSRRTYCALLWTFGLSCGLHATPLVTVFSSGFVLPESISAAPAAFGLPAGSLVVADGGNLAAQNANSMIYSLPAGGGSPTAIGGPFNTGGGTFGGTFAPSSFGSLGGDYLAFGYTGADAGAYSLNSATGTLTAFYTDPNSNSYSLDSPVLAPAGFGSVAGDILAPEAFYGGTTSTVVALSPSGTFSNFATISNFANFDGVVGGFGALFAPAGFVSGTTGPVMLVSDVNSGAIDWIDSSGNAHLFTTVPLGSSQIGLRQMAFAPSGFGAYGGDLFVSVSGSEAGGGTYGSVDVINPAGQLVGVITQGTVGAPFDPRGLYFANNNQLLIADSDPAIYSALPGAVTSPEPGTVQFVAIALGAFAMLRFGRRRAACECDKNAEHPM